MKVAMFGRFGAISQIVFYQLRLHQKTAAPQLNLLLEIRKGYVIACLLEIEG
jgi:hypothetical protein